MRVFKYVVLFTLPVLLFVNLWAFANGGSGHFKGFKDLVEYGKTFHGFDYTYQLLNNMSHMIVTQFNVGDYVLAAATGLLYLLVGPVIFIGTLVADIVANVVWFFGWIFEIGKV